MSGLTRTQEHALAVIHSYGGTVHILDWSPDSVRCGLHRCSFSARTVRGLAARGHLVRTSDEPETYEIQKKAPDDGSDRAPMATGVEDNPPLTKRSKSLLRPTAREGGPSATLQSRSATRKASASPRHGCPVGTVDGLLRSGS